MRALRLVDDELTPGPFVLPGMPKPPDALSPRRFAGLDAWGFLIAFVMLSAVPLALFWLSSRVVVAPIPEPVAQAFLVTGLPQARVDVIIPVPAIPPPPEPVELEPEAEMMKWWAMHSPAPVAAPVPPRKHHAPPARRRHKQAPPQQADDAKRLNEVQLQH